MKRILFFGTLLSVLMFSVFTSCKKEEEEPYDINVSVNNFRNDDVVYLYADGTLVDMIPANISWNRKYTTKDGNDVVFEVRSSAGLVLDKTIANKDVNSTKKGKAIICLDSNNSNSDTTNNDTPNTPNTPEVPEQRNSWSMPIEMTNSSSTPVHVYINGKHEKIVEDGYKWVTSYEIFSQSSVSIQVKTSDGKVLDSKTVSKGGSYVKTIKDPTFTITKIVLTKWYAGNWLDNPDPWFEVLVNGTSVGRTNYLSDRTDGEICTWSNLNIRIEKIYSKVTLDLYDYNLGYSSVGSSHIGGIVANDFSVFWGETSFEWSTSKMSFTIYGTWN